MIFRIRALSLLSIAAFAAAVGAWVLGWLPLIYIMPLIVLAALHAALACPRCNGSPYVLPIGRGGIGVPWKAKTCRRCGVDFVSGLSRGGDCPRSTHSEYDRCFGGKYRGTAVPIQNGARAQVDPPDPPCTVSAATRVSDASQEELACLADRRNSIAKFS